jgi:hypothetical protein
MAYTLKDFPLSTEEPRIEVNLPVGTHVLELVVEDSAGLRSLPDTVVITVEPEEIPAASITSVEPLSALRGTTFDMTIRGTGFADATGLVFYTSVTPTRPTRPTSPVLTRPTSPVLTRPISPVISDDLIRPIKVADSSITAEITERNADGIVAKVSISASSETGARTFGIITPRGTVHSGTITFTVKALPTITLPTTPTIPTLTIPTLTVPTLTIPTVTRPTLTIPTVTVPTLTIPTVTRPTLTIPTVTVPTLTIPTVTRPTLTIPTVTRPTLTVPTLTRPIIPDMETAPGLSEVKGVGKAIETKLRAAGIATVKDLAAASPKAVADILGYQDPARAKALIEEAGKVKG